MANEKRLIYLEDAKEALTGWETDPTDEEIEYVLDQLPTVDAVEVVHGYWHIDDYDSGEPFGYAAFIEVHCSKCGYELGAEAGEYGWLYGDPFPLNYCPNCGAKMDGDSNG